MDNLTVYDVMLAKHVSKTVKIQFLLKLLHVYHKNKEILIEF